METTLRRDDKVKGSQTVKVMAFCSSKDMKAQYVKSENVFLKPKPAPESADNFELIDDSGSQDLESSIDPVGLLIFGKDMNDEQRVSLFTDMTERLFAKSQMKENALEYATLSKQIIELIPSAGFQSDKAQDRIYTQMANMVKLQLEGQGISADKGVDPNSLAEESLSTLIKCVESIMKHLPRSQTNLM